MLQKRSEEDRSPPSLLVSVRLPPHRTVVPLQESQRLNWSSVVIGQESRLGESRRSELTPRTDDHPTRRWLSTFGDCADLDRTVKPKTSVRLSFPVEVAFTRSLRVGAVYYTYCQRLFARTKPVRSSVDPSRPRCGRKVLEQGKLDVGFSVRAVL